MNMEPTFSIAYALLILKVLVLKRFMGLTKGQNAPAQNGRGLIV